MSGGVQDPYDYLFKFLVIGAAGTGKSCLLHQFIESQYKEDSSHTIGVEFGSKIVPVGGRTVKLQIWDTAGQERFRSVTRSYYRGAAGALLTYDITNRESFNCLTNWLTDARTLASPQIVILMVGNKKDLEDEREVTFLEASRFAQENGLMFLETSAKTGQSVEEAFLQCSKNILAKIETGELDPERIGSGKNNTMYDYEYMYPCLSRNPIRRVAFTKNRPAFFHKKRSPRLQRPPELV